MMCNFRIALAVVGIICATLIDHSPSRALDQTWPGTTSPPWCSAIAGACAMEGKRRPVKDIEVADDYCNMRCDQQFDYCRYRDEPLERCIRRLATCRSRC